MNKQTKLDRIQNKQSQEETKLNSKIKQGTKKRKKQTGEAGRK